MTNHRSSRGFGPGTAWTDAEIERLKELFEEGLSQRRIALLIGRTKNSVHTKMNSLRLVRSPLIKPSSSNKSTIKRGKVTLPPLPSESEAHE